MNFKPRKANVAQSMGGYLWAVSSLVGEKMQVRLDRDSCGSDKAPITSHTHREWL